MRALRRVSYYRYSRGYTEGLFKGLEGLYPESPQAFNQEAYDDSI